MCIQSEQQMRLQFSQKRSDLEIPMIEAAMEGEIETHKAGSYPLTSLRASSTHQNLEHSSIQESLLETTEQVVKPEAAETSDCDIDKLLEDWRDAEGNFSEFLKNEPIEDDEPSIEYSDDGTTNTAISEKDEQLYIEFEEQQINETTRRNRQNYHQDEDKTYECPSCPRRFNTYQNVYQHKATHEGIKRKDCDICGKSIITRSLKAHKRTHNKVKPNKCDFCEKRFTRPSDLRTHMRLHTGEKPYKCKYCERSFSESSRRMKHMRNHLGDNVHRCELCPLAFPVLAVLRKHLTTHKNEDPETRERNMKALKEAEAELQQKLSKKSTQQASKDEIKSKSFNRITSLRDHIRTHTGEKPYKCKFCDRSFTKACHRTTHMRIHYGDNVHRCELCPLAFSAAKELRVHLTEHSNDDSETRERNIKALKDAEAKLQLELSKNETQQPSKEQSQQQYEMPVQKEHNTHGEDKPYKCPYCKRKFNTISNMYQHKARHEVACDICGKTIAKHHLKTHKLTHSNEKAHKCDFCGKRFARIWDLRRHMRIHHGDNIYRCELCPLAFPLVKELRAHLTVHSNDDSETRERNMKALKEAEAKLQLKLSETETQQPSKEESKQQLEIKAKENLRTYRFMHGEDKRYACPYCPRRFNHTANMRRHKEIHEGVKRVACYICGKSIIKRSLKTHKLIHSKEKPHKCDICEMSFALISNLRTHMRKHTGEKPYKCKYCDRSFTLAYRRTTHMRIHYGDNVYRCELCPLAFPLAKELRAHLTEHNNDDSETRERNMKALKEAEAKLQLKLSKKETLD